MTLKYLLQRLIYASWAWIKEKLMYLQLAREYCDDVKRKNKLIILSHHMLPGLKQGQEKMSKSDPSSSIYMEDKEVEVNRKINKAYYPPYIVEGNPCLEYIKYIIFPWFNEFSVERGVENGGNKTYNSYEELVADYEKGELHPYDLKPALSDALSWILQPVRDHFSRDANAKVLLKRVQGYRVTRRVFGFSELGIHRGKNHTCMGVRMEDWGGSEMSWWMKSLGVDFVNVALLYSKPWKPFCHGLKLLEDEDEYKEMGWIGVEYGFMKFETGNDLFFSSWYYHKLVKFNMFNYIIWSQVVA
ncbi:tyrosine--tRNA ligase cytoplasmic-like [Tripterygium wilfordii]|uniref:tyrosine--tRNA ligase n=1 Tax=Tripterygium wilfordii TaxID=458696 RepID=A0A7J7CRQ2_TRIWF|nr:tyrosine--tRNA ligase cytoplasmic-like [Tripterygium wilfordii]